MVPAALDNFHAALDELEVEIVSLSFILLLRLSGSIGLTFPSFKPRRYSPEILRFPVHAVPNGSAKPPMLPLQKRIGLPPKKPLREKQKFWKQKPSTSQQTRQVRQIWLWLVSSRILKPTVSKVPL
jgi:hypothetical protein